MLLVKLAVLAITVAWFLTILARVSPLAARVLAVAITASAALAFAASVVAAFLSCQGAQIGSLVSCMQLRTQHTPLVIRLGLSWSATVSSRASMRSRRPSCAVRWGDAQARVANAECVPGFRALSLVRTFLLAAFLTVLPSRWA